ncbi:ARM repeat-containing protein [Eremomyces bilateralis CBS 781.70]|uniref:ARM repeat-containing protein n=1 Tax=Eremomyces bilateralis CBS 781.70 TaxID=1392243 RepID=A0A6G1G1F8_9PEZI|nr:ARM repeat-containing protein [Eremomyces bilateralis CBS 781.70]KAF1811639.1 ARM repeat-containing protein [Eremomyces bilateralis CBS 781.70]
MEDQAAALLTALKKSTISVEQKATLFNKLKSDIKHLRVPEPAQATIFECIRIAIGSNTSPQLVSTGFASLGHLIKRLHLQDQDNTIAAQANKLFPLLLERLGDARESHRAAASQTLADIWPYDHADVEHVIKANALQGNNARAKETAMQWVVKMNKTEGLPFRAYVPYLVTALEDADGQVRESAKSAIIELFRSAPEHAKGDLQKQMNSHGVRKTIVSYISSQFDSAHHAPEPELKASTMSLHARALDRKPSDSTLGDSLALEPPPAVEVVPMDPIYVHTQRDLEDNFRNMLPDFEGRESEHNWIARDKNVTKIRRLAKGNAPSDFHGAFVVGIKSLLDGILKVANSLRTTTSTNGCLVVQELVKLLGPGMDSMTEILLQSFTKMTANTKKISATNGDATADAIFQNVSYNLRLMQHVWSAFQDKNASTRACAPGWLKTLINKHSPHRTHFEHSGGLDLTEKCIKKGLADQNPKVREGTRGVYWIFAKTWPQKAEAIMSNLLPKDRLALENASANPNASLSASFSSAAGPATSRPPTATSRSTLRDTIAAQRRAALLATKKLPDRPISAQAAFTPARQAPSTSTSHTPATTASRTAKNPSVSVSAARSAVGASATSNAGLKAGPVRRPRRPELPRPATADPYASRNASRKAVKASTPVISPNNSPARDTVKKSVPSRATVKTPARLAQTHGSPTRTRNALGHTATRKNVATDQSMLSSPTSTPSKDESLTMVLPGGADGEHAPSWPPRKRAALDKTMSVDMGIASLNEDDGFTMVVPDLNSITRASPAPRMSLQRSETPRMSPHILSEIPVRSRAISPTRRSPERTRVGAMAGSEMIDEDEVKVYEDPFVAYDSTAIPSSSSPQKPVLEEVPANEQPNTYSRDLSSAHSTSSHSTSSYLTSPHKPPSNPAPAPVPLDLENLSPQDRASYQRNRRLLTSGIERIRARTLDAHGLRRVQDLVRGSTTLDIFASDSYSTTDQQPQPSSRFADLLTALLDYLEAPSSELKLVPQKAQSLKAQVLVTIRAMLALRRREMAPALWGATLRSLVQARREYEGTEHVAAELERAAEEVVRMGPVQECLTALLEVMEAVAIGMAPGTDALDESPSASLEDPIGDARVVVLGLSVLGQLLRVAQGNRSPAPSSALGVGATDTQRLGRLALRLLNSTDPDVRRADLEFCLELHERLGQSSGAGKGDAEEFWKVVGGAREQHLNLITYYLARRHKA